MSPLIRSADFAGAAEEIRSLTREELLALKLRLEERPGEPWKETPWSARPAAQYGDFSDREWFERAEAFARIAGRQCQAIQQRLSELRLERRVESEKVSHATFAEEFMRQAKRALTGSVYEAICKATNGELRKASESPEKGGVS